MEIFLTTLVIVGIVMLFFGFILEEFVPAFIGLVLILLFGLINLLTNIENKKSYKIKYIYKVRELERNTVFNITDTVNSLEANDTIWVDVKNKKVNPLDTTAMMCVVVKAIK